MIKSDRVSWPLLMIVLFVFLACDMVFLNIAIAKGEGWLKSIIFSILIGVALYFALVVVFWNLFKRICHDPRWSLLTIVYPILPLLLYLFWRYLRPSSIREFRSKDGKE